MDLLANFSFDWSAFDQANVTIERQVPAGANAIGEPTFAVAEIYSGLANVEPLTQTIVDLPEGQIPGDRISVLIDPATSGYLPTIEIGDRVTIAIDSYVTRKYLVTMAHTWDLSPASVEIEATSQKVW